MLTAGARYPCIPVRGGTHQEVRVEPNTAWRPCPFYHPGHLQAELGDVVYVELPEVGKQVKKGDTFGVVESVKVRCSWPCMHAGADAGVGDPVA